MPSSTFSASAEVNERMLKISFYKEIPGGWKLDITKESGDSVWNGDRWAENVDELVSEIGNLAGDIPDWLEEETGERVSFFSAIWRAVASGYGA